MNDKPNYKTWIRMNKLITIIIITLFFIIIALLPINIYIRIISAVFALPFLYMMVILSSSYYQFAPFGGNYQSKIHDLIVSNLKAQEKGKILDIGSGSGSLIIKLAKAFPNAAFIGIDYWGDNWEYSKKQCEENAKIEGVSDKIGFQKASASKLPFEDSLFDSAVSCLTFHEVKDEKDKVKIIKEALRVIKPGGSFVFLDLFMDNKIYGEYADLVKSVKELGVKEIDLIKLRDEMKLPFLLLHKRVLGNAMIVTGIK
ncbi:MAG: class I SAM-dependent methyltransferase [Bacillota bacterium]|nr:class I SAM-dependent methyltransferase [Bacillota bacterium]